MTTLVRWTARSSWDSAFDDLVRKAFTPEGPTWVPAADIVSHGEDITIAVDLPGVSESDLEVEVKDRTLTIQGKRTLTIEGTVMRQEIRSGAFSRTFTLPAHVGTDQVTASYHNGILLITISGAQPASISKRISVSGLRQPVAVESEATQPDHTETPDTGQDSSE